MNKRRDAGAMAAAKPLITTPHDPPITHTPCSMSAPGGPVLLLSLNPLLCLNIPPLPFPLPSPI